MFLSYGLQHSRYMDSQIKTETELFLFRQCCSHSLSHCSMIPKNYQHVLAFIFAMQEINKNAKFLSNITLGSTFYENAFNPLLTCWNTLALLFMGQRNPPNYHCNGEERLVAVIGGLTSQNSIQMANILNTYKIPQVCV